MRWTETIFDVMVPAGKANDDMFRIFSPFGWTHAQAFHHTSRSSATMFTKEKSLTMLFILVQSVMQFRLIPFFQFFLSVWRRCIVTDAMSVTVTSSAGGHIEKVVHTHRSTHTHTRMHKRTHTRMHKRTRPRTK